MKQSIETNSATTLLKTIICALFMINISLISYGGEKASYDIPSLIDNSDKYLFFLHNYFVEKNGPDGACKYYDLLQAFVDNGYTVISEVRTGEVVPSEYARKIVTQVKILLDAGVPPENITIAGHSKGGVITLCVASQLENPKIGFIVMAGCGIKPLAKSYPNYSKLKGKCLSIYAVSDPIAGSCQKIFSKAIAGFSNEEIKLESDKGHQLFFQPEDSWFKPVMAWLKQRK